MYRRTSLWVLVFLSIASCAAVQEYPAADLAIINVTVVDVEKGTLLPRQSVLIRGDRIVGIGSSARTAVPSTATVVDAEERYLIPGLFDMHVHSLFDESLVDGLLALLVANGVTGIRDMGGLLEVSVTTRERVSRGELIGPRIVAAGPILDGPSAVHPEVSWALGTPGEAERAVDSLMTAGVDFLKVYSMLPREAFFEIADRANRAGVPFAGHVPLSVTPVEAARAGIASIEHLHSELELFCTSVDPAACVEPFRVFENRGTWQTPTLVVRRNRAFLDDSTIVTGPGFSHAPTALRSEWSGIRTQRLSRGSDYFEQARGRHREERWLTGLLHREDIPILAGSDAGVLYSVHGFSLHEELELLVASGLSPAEALRTATVNPALFLATSDSLGAVATGNRADLVLLDANPLVDIRNTRRIRAVVLKGRLLERSELDRLLISDLPQ